MVGAVITFTRRRGKKKICIIPAAFQRCLPECSSGNSQLIYFTDTRLHPLLVIMRFSCLFCCFAFCMCVSLRANARVSARARVFPKLSVNLVKPLRRGG